MEDNFRETLDKVLNSLVTEGDEFDYIKSLLTSNVEILETIFSNYFRKIEGFACSYDKASFTVQKIIESLETRTNKSLIQTYNVETHPQMKPYEGEPAYWCPKTLKDTEGAIRLVESILYLNFDMLTEKMNEVKEIG